MITTKFVIYRTDDDHVYKCRIEFARGKKRVSIYGCELYNTEGEYVGYWDAHNIPLDVLDGWRKFIRTNYGMTGDTDKK